MGNSEPKGLIADVKNRKTMFRKRKKNVYKKADELSKLCDIDVCLIVYEYDRIQPEIWPQDPIEFNRILNKYKAFKDVPVPGLKRKFDSSDFYEAKEKDVDVNEVESLGKQISEEKYPTWDDRINEFSKDELIRLIASIEAKIEVSTKKIDSMERYKRFATKQNQSSLRAEPSTSNAPRHMNWKPTNYDAQKPNQVSDNQTCDDQLGASNTS